MGNFTFSVKNFGPIHSAEIGWGDLTILVGPQASGKSLLLELFKFLVDKEQILATLRRYNYTLDSLNPEKVFDLYFGDGLSSLMSKDTFMSLNGKEFMREMLADQGDSPATEALFYVPAQRILSIADGRPKNFMEFDISTPYVLRNFSETLRLTMQGAFVDSASLFPIGNRLRNEINSSLDASIFHGGKVVMDNVAGQRKMKLDVGGTKLPFMTWSAGQKEFMPLLLSFYCLRGMHGHTDQREPYRYAVIEEPEMGLHPQAILSVLLQILELVASGLKVMISTHSTTILEFAWAFNVLKELEPQKRVQALAELFGIASADAVSAGHVLSELAGKNIKTYYFSRSDCGVNTVNISSLNPGSDESSVAMWGGLSEFSSRAADVVSKYVS